MSNINKYLESLRKVTNSTSMEDSTVGERGQFISTGSYALNRIISGDFFGGIPSDRLVVIYGENQCIPRDQKIKILIRMFN